MDKVWLVTGSASGLGRNIAEAVLESGDRLVATARNPRRLDDLVNKFGERTAIETSAIKGLRERERWSRFRSSSATRMAEYRHSTSPAGHHKRQR